MLEYTPTSSKGKAMTLIIKNASDDFANAIQSLAKIDNAIVQLQDEAQAHPLEQTQIYKDFEKRMATNPSDYAKLLQEVRDEVFNPYHKSSTKTARKDSKISPQ